MNIFVRKSLIFLNGRENNFQKIITFDEINEY